MLKVSIIHLFWGRLQRPKGDGVPVVLVFQSIHLADCLVPLHAETKQLWAGRTGVPSVAAPTQVTAAYEDTHSHQPAQCQDSDGPSRIQVF